MLVLSFFLSLKSRNQLFNSKDESDISRPRKLDNYSKITCSISNLSNIMFFCFVFNFYYALLNVLMSPHIYLQTLY